MPFKIYHSTDTRFHGNSRQNSACMDKNTVAQVNDMVSDLRGPEHSPCNNTGDKHS